MRTISKARETRIAGICIDPDVARLKRSSDADSSDRSVGEDIPNALHPHLDRTMQRFATRHRIQFDDKSEDSQAMYVRKAIGANIHLFIQASVFSTRRETTLCIIPSIAIGAGGDDWKLLEAAYVRKGVQKILLSEIDPSTKDKAAIAGAISEKLDIVWKYLSELTR